MKKTKKTTKSKKSSILIKTGAASAGIFALIFSLFQGMGLGFGNGFGLGQSSEGNKPTIQQEDTPVEKTQAEEVSPKEEIKEEESVKTEETIVSVTVVENNYFYQNERLPLDELTNKLKLIEGKLTVEITDDNASLNAYTQLLDKLDELGIDYIETW